MIIITCQTVIKTPDFAPKVFPWISKLLETRNCMETWLVILKKDSICHCWWQRKVGRHELSMPQKVTDWKKPTELIPTVPLQVLYFLKIKTLDQILGGGLDLEFSRQSWTMLIVQQPSCPQSSLFWIPISSLSFASSELKPKYIHLPQGKGGSSYQLSRAQEGPPKWLAADPVSKTSWEITLMSQVHRDMSLEYFQTPSLWQESLRFFSYLWITFCIHTC